MNTLNLKLEKPLVFLKIHTTGLNPKMDRIVQITLKKIHVDGTSKYGTRLVNPEIPIPEEATQANGITNEMIKNKPTFYQVAQSIFDFIKDSDIAGFNIKNFDLKFLMEEFFRAQIDFDFSNNKIIDLQEIYHNLYPRDFVEAASVFAGKSFQRGTPISSEDYAETSFGILNGFIDKFEEGGINLPNGEKFDFKNDVDSLNKAFGNNSSSVDMKGYIIKNEKGKLIFNYGKKWINKSVAKMIMEDMSYVTWLLSQDVIPRDTKNILNNCISSLKEQKVV